MQMAFGIYISLIICIMIPIMKSQNTVLQTTKNCEAQLSEMNGRMNALESLIPEIMGTLKDVKNQVDELKKSFNAQVNSETNKSSEYAIHYYKKNWMDADLYCKARGGRLVSFESVQEYNLVADLIQSKCSGKGGFWTSARDLGSDSWIWRDSGEFVIDDIWGTSEPNGDGNCGHMKQTQPGYPLKDRSCDSEMCYICESP